MDTSIDFDATQVKPATGGYEPLPVGTYPVQITAAEKVANSAGTGWMVKAEMTVLDGDYQGRKHYERYNLSNPNPDAVRIAQEQFSALCHATGVLQPRDLSQLLNLPFLVKMKVNPPKNGYDASNAITQYLKIDGSKIGAAAAGAASVQSAAPTTKKSATPPWAGKAAA